MTASIPTQNQVIDDVLRVGDQICLFCEESSGYVFSELTTSDTNILYTFYKQDPEKPKGINDPQMVTFRIHIQNRYKLNKRYQELKEQAYREPLNDELMEKLEQAKNDADTENKDNAAEQLRLRGKVIKYGDVIQLKHEFSNKYLHSSQKRPGERQKHGFMTYLDENNSKAAQFRFLPKYRLNKEGDDIYDGDHVVIESVKSLGHYLQATEPFLYYDRGKRCELLCSVVVNEFTVIKRTDNNAGDGNSSAEVWGGSVLQLNHKHIEAYLCADVTDSKQNNVHLHVYETNGMKSDSLYPPQSSATFWQILPEVNILQDKTLFWGSQIRLKHFISHRYLYLDKDNNLGLTEDGYSARSVFRLHRIERHGTEATTKVKGTSLESFRCIGYQSLARIEHVKSGKWLHGVEDTGSYVVEEAFDSHQMTSAKKITVSSEILYYDAFSLHRISDDELSDANFIIGVTQLIKITLYQLSENKELSEDETRKIINALGELTEFLDQPVESKRQKTRKIHVRELKVIDQLVRLMQFLTSENTQLELPMLIHSTSNAFMSCIRSDDDNCLYVTQFMDFFENHISMKEGNHIGASMIQILLELIRNRRDVIGTLTVKQIDKIIYYFRKYQHHCYLNVLCTFCVCDGKGIAQNQRYIGEHILDKHKSNLFSFVIYKDQVCAIRNDMAAPVPLAAYFGCQLLIEELKLFTCLCKGRNQYCIDKLTVEQEYFTWDVLFGILQATDIHVDIRALFCQLVIALYVDVSENCSLLETSSYTYLYDKLDQHKTAHDWLDQQAQFVERSLDEKVPKLQHWLHPFLQENMFLEQEKTKSNNLVLEAWNLVYHLIEFGYYSLTKIQHLFPVMLQVLRGDSTNTDKEKKLVSETNAVDITALVKYRVLLILELALELQFKYRVEILVATYVEIEKGESNQSRQKRALADFLTENQDKSSLFSWTSPKTEWNKVLDNIIKTCPMPVHDLEGILLKLAQDVHSAMTCQESCDEDSAYANITSKVLLLMRNHFRRRSQLLQACQEALILLSERNQMVFKDVQTFMPLLSRLTATSLDEETGKIVCAILNKFKNYCQKDCPQHPDEPDAIGQKILVNQGILPILFRILETDVIYLRKKEDIAIIETVVNNCLELMQELCRENSNVQKQLYDNLDVLLNVSYSPRMLAETLRCIFENNQKLCESIGTTQIQQLARLSFKYKAVAPNFLQLLKTLIQTDPSGERINTRMQYVFAKMGMDFRAQQGFRILNMSSAEKEDVLMGKYGSDLLAYFVNMTNIISLISKDTKESIQSFCSAVFSLKEVLGVLIHPDICANIKRPFLKLFHWAFLPQKHRIILTKSFWIFMDRISSDLDRIHQYVCESGVPLVDTFDDCFIVTSDTDPATVIASELCYYIESVLPFLKTFSSMFMAMLRDTSKYKETYKHIVKTGKELFPLIVPYINNKYYLRIITSSIRAVMTSCYYGEEAISSTLKLLEDKFATCYPINEDKNQGPLYKAQDTDSISDREEELNNKLRIFVRNCQIMNAPVNSIGKQLGCMEKRYVKLAYTEIGSGKQLPLSDEFQQHCRAFISPEHTATNLKYQNTVILIQHLKNVAGRIDKTTVTNQMLAHGALQILRALLHNIIVILPGDILTSKRKTRKYRIRLQQLQELQDLYVSKGLVHLVMTLIGTQNQAIFRESLALLEYMLFGTGRNVQDAALDFFEKSREEALFMIINDFLKYSAELMKERRFIADRSEKQIMKQKTEEYQKIRKNRFFAKLSFKSSQKQVKVGIINSYQNDDTFERRSEHTKQDFFQEQTLKMNTRTIQLILNVVAKLADGYHIGLQDYLREQPDNLKSFNIVAAVTEYLGNMYTYVNKDNIELTVDIFDALGKTCLGNQKNRLVILDNKIIDCVNYILKQRSWEGCSNISVLNLKRSVAKLLMSLTEENSPSALKVAKDVAQTLDIEAVLSNMEICQHMEQNMTGVTSTVGHRMYIIFSRMKDIMSNSEDNQWLALAAEHKSVIDHYKSQVYSVEIVKDGYLQKAYFPFDKAHYVRDDLKRRLKWNVDRTSPTNKIRDFMTWSNVIIRDYYHQEKILSSFMGRLVVRRRIAWDYMLVLLSFLINLYMLVCWVGQDPGTTQNIHKLTTTSPIVRFDYKSLEYTLLSCEILHNVVSLMLLCSYFLAQHPSLPRWCSRTKKEDMTSSVDMEGPESKTHNYNTKLFSAKTAYYFVLSIMSIVGTAVTPYCFAFHLLHIVEVNTLLQGVIRAITKNGKSLLWVAILGFCVLYIYGLIGFAFFRHIFEPTNQLYCKTLYECTTTVSTYGLIGLMGEMVTLHSEDNNFLIFLSWAAYQITFFIFFSTIGLNIIFGIIVDTFSELRDMKWRAEKDMHDVCFICGLPSYDFEHHTKGFYHHTHYEHNMWTYIYYFIYLSTTNRSEYTALDYYVADQRRRGLVDFFPANRALSLSFLEQNKENILDELRKDITFLKQRQQQLDIERHLQEQDKKQKQWRHILLSQLSMSSATESLTRTPPVELPSIQEEAKQENLTH